MQVDTGELGDDIEIGDAGSKRRGLFARQRLSPQDVIHTIHRPALIAISTSRLPYYCYNCYAGSKPVDNNGYSIGAQQDASLKVCTGCQMAHFCGKSCQTEAWKSFHKYECKKFAKWRTRLGMPFNESNRAILRFILQHDNGVLPEGLWEKVMNLESHVENLKDNVSGEDSRTMRYGIEAMQKYTETDIDAASVLKLTFVLKINAMVLTTTCGEPIGVFLDTVVSRMNHSCDGGNVVIHRPLYTNCTGWRSQASAARPVMTLFPVREILKGEELTITYIDREQDVHQRRGSLKETYSFTCECDRCEHDLQELADTEQRNPSLLKELKAWSETVAEQKDLLESAGSSVEDVGRAIRTIEGVVSAMKSKPGFSVRWSPYSRAVHELRLAYMREPAAYDEALLCAMEEYFIIRPAVYAHPLDPWRTIHAIFLVELLGMFADSYHAPDTDARTVKQRQAIEAKGFGQMSFMYWYFRICQDVRNTLSQSAAADLGDVFLKLQIQVGVPSGEVDKLLRDGRIRSKAEEDMKSLLKVDTAKWTTILKR